MQGTRVATGLERLFKDETWRSRLEGRRLGWLANATAVDNKLEPGSEDKIGVELKFESFDDFSPERIAQQVDPLKALLEKRQNLADLKGKLATNRNLNKAIQEALGDESSKERLKSELESAEGDEDGGS